MRTIIACGRSAAELLVYALVLIIGVPSAYAAVGSTPAKFAVSQTGAATYTIPIWTPAGPAGLQPRIALTYNSQQGNSTMGVGWSLTGLSSIYRCNKTLAQDGAPSPVTLATSDGLCMDGKRLRLTSGTYGQAGSTYQTEVADFSIATAYGSAGNGPAYFIVKDRNGRSYQYGNGGSSQVLANGSTTALSWQLNQVSDPAGNTMIIAYTTGTGTAVPATISWTPTSYGATTYQYTMTFSYGTNVDQSSYHGYVAGTSVTNANLLSSIAINYTGQLVKKYILSYQAAPNTGRNELYQIQECADSAATNCLRPTAITYQSGTSGVGSAVILPNGNSGGYSFAGYDFDGDGRSDLVWVDNSGIWYVAFGTSTGYSAAVSTGIAALDATSLYPSFGRVDGSGKDVLLSISSNTWFYYKWNGSSFVGTSTGVAVGTDKTASGTYSLADVNRDGLADLITTGSDGYLYVRLNTSNSSVSFASSSTKTIAISAFTKITSGFGGSRRLDFYGSGQDDLLAADSNLNYSVLHFNGVTFASTALTATAVTAVDMADYNDDGCTDILLQTSLQISRCSGSPAQSIPLPATALAAIDWDGDGRMDLIGTNFNVYKSIGTGFSSTPIATSLPTAGSPSFTVVHNPTGDGLDGLVMHLLSDYHIRYFLHNGAGQPPDLMTNVVDGYGNSEALTYVSLAQNNYSPATDAVYPEQNYVGPMYVVSKVLVSDPTNPPNGTYQQLFWYYYGWTNLQGRGFDGFQLTSLQDFRSSGLATYDRYLRNFPWTGIHDQTTVSNGVHYLTQSTTAYSGTTQDSTLHNERYFVFPVNIDDKTWETGGPKDGNLITEVSTSFTVYDAYGNVKHIDSAKYDRDTTSPYYNDYWLAAIDNTPAPNATTNCVGLLSASSVTYTASVGASVTRSKQFTPDTIKCRYSEVITAPGTAYQVIEDLGYDSYGNVTSDAVTGTGMPTRTTSLIWNDASHTTGQFPLTVTDASGAQVQMAYSYNYGLLNSVTDANGAQTAWQYTDGFGRMTRENDPDGTYTTLTYNDCSTYGTGCLLSSHALAVEWDKYNQDGTKQTAGTRWFDSLEREVLNEHTMIVTSNYARNEIRFDNYGRIAKRAFPCAYTSVAAACPYWTTFTYDSSDRVTQVQRPISSSNSTPQTTSYLYEGRTTIATDPQTFTITTVDDVNGWRRQTQDAYGYTVTLGYDAAGARTLTTDSAGNQLWSGSYQYGVGPFLVGETDIDRGSWSYTVNALGEKTAWNDAKSQSFSATYDALSRPLTRKEPDLFTQWTWGSTPASHNVGKLSSVCTGTGATPTNCTTSPGYSESETYDALGRLGQRSITLPSVGSYTYTWAYNATTGLLDTLTYPLSTSGQSLVLKYGYSWGILSSVTDTSDSPNVSVWQANVNNYDDQVTQETLGNGIVTTRNFDAVTHWLGSVQAGVGGGAGALNLSFLYDQVGNVIQRQDGNHSLTENIYYDNVYRTSYTKLNLTQNLSLSYDVTGNITSRSDIAGGATWTYDAVHKHQVKQAGSTSYAYTYDNNGNMLTRQGQAVGWASYNYPTSISAGSGSTAETIALSYGPDRQRWQQVYTGNGTTETTNYVGGLMDIVRQGTVTDYRHYIYAGSMPVAVYSRKSTGVNTFSYILSDHQGSVSAITNSSGGTTINESFTPFGVRRNPTTWSGAASNTDLSTTAGITRQGYTFQTSLGLWTGLSHLNGRVFDGIIGRMLSADPIIQDMGNTQNFNRYSYVFNNPLTFTDPSGFGFTCEVTPGGICENITVTPPPAPPPSRPPLPGNTGPTTLPPGAGPGVRPGGGSRGPSGGSSQPVTKNPSVNQPQKQPCQTFADDMAARKAIAAQRAAQALVAASAVNDFIGATADVSGSLGKALGRSAEAAEGLSRASTGVAIVFTAGDVATAVRTRDPDAIFDAGYGVTALAAGFVVPPFGVGLSLAKLIDSLTPEKPDALEQEMASVGPQCTPH